MLQPPAPRGWTRATVSGRTYDWAEQLRGIGGVWDRARKVWVVEAHNDLERYDCEAFLRGDRHGLSVSYEVGPTGFAVTADPAPAEKALGVSDPWALGTRARRPGRK